MSKAPVYPKRLIEVDLPIKKISAHARREKSIRHGHISTMHIWWARRPLAACRAVVLGALWPAPTDPNCPKRFIREAANLLAEFHDRRFHVDRAFSTSAALQQGLLSFIADFANWDNANDLEFLRTARALVQSAHEALGGTPGSHPLIADPFAGGGAIPLEALRVGADAVAADLNPVAVLLNRVMLELIPKEQGELANQVREWGERIKERVQKDVSKFYPADPDGATPIAYLWARTIRCEGPNCGVVVPLLRSPWISKKGRASVAVSLLTARSKQGIEIRCEVVDAKSLDKKSLVGTVRAGAASCPACGYSTPVERVRAQLRERRGGADDAKLLAVVISRAGAARTYRSPVAGDERAFSAARDELAKRLKVTPSLIPDEPLPPQGTLGFRVQAYGVKQWRDMYSSRQSLALSSFCTAIKRAESEDGCPHTVALLLALALGRLQDLNSSFSTWANTIAAICGANRAQNRVPMVWDFVEAVPIAGAGGDWTGQVEWIARVCEHIKTCSISPGTVVRSPAQTPCMPMGSVDAVVTDPPYYDAFAYADLSDIFLAWLKRAVGDPKREFLLAKSSDMSPKELELVVNEGAESDGRGTKDKAWFESQMGTVFREWAASVKEDGLGVVVFAHKGTDSWEALLGGLISGGWRVSASWPIDTERPNRQRAQDSAALGSSVHLVCRPRASDTVGEWRDVLVELPGRIHEWMPRLAGEGVVGADAIFACLGPALEIFSRYSRVEKPSGDTVTLKEYLEEVWAAVAKEALTRILAGADAAGFEEDARLTAMWLWTLSKDGGGEEENEEEAEDADDSEESAARKRGKGGFALEFDAARKIAQGLGAHLEELTTLVEVKGETARLLPVVERTRALFGKGSGAAGGGSAPKKKRKQQLALGFVDELEEAEAEAGWSDTGTPEQAATVLDRVHQAMILFGAGRAEALKRFLVEDGIGRDGRFWKLAQALSPLYPTGTDERRWVEGVLARKKGLGF